MPCLCSPASSCWSWSLEKRRKVWVTGQRQGLRAGQGLGSRAPQGKWCLVAGSMALGSQDSCFLPLALGEERDLGPTSHAALALSSPHIQGAGTAPWGRRRSRIFHHYTSGLRSMLIPQGMEASSDEIGLKRGQWPAVMLPATQKGKGLVLAEGYTSPPPQHSRPPYLSPTDRAGSLQRLSRGNCPSAGQKLSQTGRRCIAQGTLRGRREVSSPGTAPQCDSADGNRPPVCLIVPNLAQSRHTSELSTPTNPAPFSSQALVPVRCLFRVT